LDGFAAGRQTGVEAVGLVIGKESVWVNNQAALPRMAIFGGDVVQTGKNSSAVLNFRSGSAAALEEDSEVALGWAMSPTSLNLHQGAMVVHSSGLQPTRVSVLGASVTAQGEGGFPAICRIAAVGRSVGVFNGGGHVEIHGAGGNLVLPKGTYVQLEAGRPQGAGQRAGTVNAAIPAETVYHAGETKEKAVTLKLKDAVLEQDTVNTQKTGRVRIELLDGSFLNIGARSEMKITTYNPQRQQTVMDMTVGRLRGEVVKLKPGGSFQVRTQTAVIGVTGTIFVILATPQFTRVWCIEGALEVSNIIAAIAGTTTLHAGDMTSVPRGAPPTGAVHFSPSQLQAQVNQTTVTGPGAPAAAVSNVASNVVNAGKAAGGATTAGVSGATIARADAAASAAHTATTSLTDIVTETSAATSAANAVTTTSAQITSAAPTIQQAIISASTPCGCVPPS
jgi:ferric-dicitrate binding protein FerR (iron transport regulator)